jgi:hypothetical protein
VDGEGGAHEYWMEDVRNEGRFGRERDELYIMIYNS